MVFSPFLSYLDNSLHLVRGIVIINSYYYYRDSGVCDMHAKAECRHHPNHCLVN